MMSGDITKIYGSAFAVGYECALEESKNNICKNCQHYEIDKWEENRGTCRTKGQVQNVMTDHTFECNNFKGLE